MKWTKFFIPTTKETPKDATAPSHILMLRAGLIRQLAAGASLSVGSRTDGKCSGPVAPGGLHQGPEAAADPAARARTESGSAAGDAQCRKRPFPLSDPTRRAVSLGGSLAVRHETALFP